MITTSFVSPIWSKWRHLAVKFNFRASWTHFTPFPPPQTMLLFSFLDCTDHSAYTTLNWGAGGTRKSIQDADKIEQMLKYRKESFPKSVSTTFVAHCSYCLLCYLIGCHSINITWKTPLILVECLLLIAQKQTWCPPLLLIIKSSFFLFWQDVYKW